MNATDPSERLAIGVLAAIHAAGVRTICLCPGGRNAALVAACDAAREAFNMVTFFEERSAGFFALGRIRRDGAPVAVITTSGTAAAELLPAMLEARHQGLPLIAVTADRPHRLRGTGAPQTIDQIPLFAAAGAPVADVDSADELSSLPPLDGPFHFNVRFEEPSVGKNAIRPDFGATPPRREPSAWMEEGAARAVCEDFFRIVKNPLILVSSLDVRDADALAPWLAAQGSPLHLEGVSQLRERTELQKYSLRSGERILSTAEARAACDGILRIGGIPTPRFWRECEHETRPLLHVSRVNLPGLAGNPTVIPLPIFLQIAGEFRSRGGDAGALWRRDANVLEQLEKLLAKEPASEAALVRALATRLPDDARVFLGNSLPIREWDLAAPRDPNKRIHFANRGVNGIDGLVSSALGLAGAGRPLVSVLGDLSALYDLAGLWPAAQLPDNDITIAVINNGGGQIFQRMFGHPLFLNAHGIRLRAWAEMFGWSHGEMRAAEDSFPADGPRLIEVLPDAEATRRFSDGYSALWR